MPPEETAPMPGRGDGLEVVSLNRRPGNVLLLFRLHPFEPHQQQCQVVVKYLLAAAFTDW
jgi:hypothetical protein